VLLGIAGAAGVLALAPTGWPSTLAAITLAAAGLAALPLAWRAERRHHASLADCLVNHERFGADLAPVWNGHTEGTPMAKTIMIVDDSASLRQVVGIALRGAGYGVLTAVAPSVYRKP
jgi:hypothetical protein